jgi:hypothetical protein
VAFYSKPHPLYSECFENLSHLPFRGQVKGEFNVISARLMSLWTAHLSHFIVKTNTLTSIFKHRYLYELFIHKCIT